MRLYTVMYIENRAKTVKIFCLLESIYEKQKRTIYKRREYQISYWT